MQPQNVARALANRCASISASAPARPMILLMAEPGTSGLARMAVFQQAGFDVEFAEDAESIIRVCLRRAHQIRVVVVVESGEFGPREAADLTRRLSAAVPDVPCVLLPPGASRADSEVAVRTAIRWRSIASMKERARPSRP